MRVCRETFDRMNWHARLDSEIALRSEFPREKRKTPYHFLLDRRVRREGKDSSWTILYDLPMSMPVMNTSAPPSPTCRAAENTGVSMNRCRTQVMTPSSTRTTTMAITNAI